MFTNKKRLVFILVLMIFSFIFINSIEPTYSLFKSSKEVEGSIVVPGDNYCINEGFNKLSDCMLVMENYSTSVDSAKNYIVSKGSGTFSKIAPSVNYKETTTDVSDINGVISTSSHFTLGSGYTFDSSTGMFTLTDYNDNVLTDEYINYYTCGSTTSSLSSCFTIYQIKSYTTNTNSNGDVSYIVTSAVEHSYSAFNALNSEVGLYSASDNEGTSYYYRGNVKNNYVSFAGFIWRIIRQNSNGTVRLIYSGTSAVDSNDDPFIGSSQYNAQSYDPTYVGYKYSENFSLNTTNSTATEYNNFLGDVVYYFGSGYTFDDTTKKFSLTGDLVSGTWENIYEQSINSYPYTCFSTSSTGTCDVMIKTLGYINSYTANVNLISYSSSDYNSTLQNTTDSIIKANLDSWYEYNILNKTDSSSNSYASYLSDEVFCNDRSVKNGFGYLLVPTTYYGSDNRLISNTTPSLVCSQSADRFTVSSSKGNAALKYPVGLITADEVSMAGGLANSVNTNYYLYIGQPYWTASPRYFLSLTAQAHVFGVDATGMLSNYEVTNTDNKIRPVINLSSDVVISGGNGTASNPYVVAE